MITCLCAPVLSGAHRHLDLLLHDELLSNDYEAIQLLLPNKSIRFIRQQKLQ